jgi:FKBP-type peptidyl-prolyl cis-trans isomerase 2
VVTLAVSRCLMGTAVCCNCDCADARPEAAQDANRGAPRGGEAACRARIRPIVLIALLASLLAALGEIPNDDEKEGPKMVEEGSQVGIEYTLTLEDGTQVDTNVGRDVLRFEQGSGQIIPGLDKELLGMAVGDSKHVTLQPEEGYGPMNQEAYAEVPVSELPEGAREVGTPLTTRDEKGRTRRLTVHKIEGETATLDFNHPLAGRTLVIDVKVLEVN